MLDCDLIGFVREKDALQPRDKNGVFDGNNSVT